MWATSAPVLWPVRWCRSLVVWLVALARRVRPSLPRSEPRERGADVHLRRQSLPCVELRTRSARSRPTARLRPTALAARSRPTALATAALVSSEAPARRTSTAPVPVPISPSDIEQTLALLADLGGLLVLDLSGTPSPPLEHCKVIATSWPSPSVQPPHTRLAIVMKFEHWALLRTVLADELALLKTKGVDAILFYEEQRWDEWFLQGKIVHDVSRVLRTLGALDESRQVEGRGALPASHWKILLATAASLLEGSPPDLLCELTRIALSCGANEEALDFANEAASSAPRGSVYECRALRLLGVVMMRQGLLRAGPHAIEDALDLAISIGANVEAAEAMNQLGLYELARGERDAAESRLRAAIALCPSEHAELWVALRDGLAESRMN